MGKGGKHPEGDAAKRAQGKRRPTGPPPTEIDAFCLGVASAVHPPDERVPDAGPVLELALVVPGGLIRAKLPLSSWPDVRDGIEQTVKQHTNPGIVVPDGPVNAAQLAQDLARLKGGDTG